MKNALWVSSLILLFSSFVAWNGCRKEQFSSHKAPEDLVFQVVFKALHNISNGPPVVSLGLDVLNRGGRDTTVYGWNVLWHQVDGEQKTLFRFFEADAVELHEALGQEGTDLGHKHPYETWKGPLLVPSGQMRSLRLWFICNQISKEHFPRPWPFEVLEFRAMDVDGKTYLIQ